MKTITKLTFVSLLAFSAMASTTDCSQPILSCQSIFNQNLNTTPLNIPIVFDDNESGGQIASPLLTSNIIITTSPLDPEGTWQVDKYHPIQCPTPSGVPEPKTVVMLGIGLVILGCWKKGS